MSSKTKIAIMGANSHIAKGLIYNFLKAESCTLYLFTTNLEKTEQFLNSLKSSTNNYNLFDGYDNFSNNSFDVIINCVGVGTSNKIDGNYWKWFTVTEEFDNLAIQYLQSNLDVLYISISSGAVYGNDFSEPANEQTVNFVKTNKISSENYYSIARLNAETKHRSLQNLNIIDLRIFSYFSRYIDLSDKYLLTEIVNSINSKSKFVTNNRNITRDFIHPDDLFSIVIKCVETEKTNDSFDLYSAKTIDKNEILEFFRTKYKLEIEIIKNQKIESGTGSKEKYYSTYHKAEQIGYKPKFTSLDVIANEAKHLIEGNNE